MNISNYMKAYSSAIARLLIQIEDPDFAPFSGYPATRDAILPFCHPQLIINGDGNGYVVLLFIKRYIVMFLATCLCSYFGWHWYFEEFGRQNQFVGISHSSYTSNNRFVGWFHVTFMLVWKG